MLLLLTCSDHWLLFAPPVYETSVCVCRGRWLLECARDGRKVDERPYLIDTPSELPAKLDDDKITAASSDAAAKPAASRLRRNDDEMTTSSDSRTKTVDASSSMMRHNVNEMTPTSNNARTTTPMPTSNNARTTTPTPTSNNARTTTPMPTSNNARTTTPAMSPPNARCTDRELTAKSVGKTVQSVVQKIDEINKTDNTDRTTDRVVISAPANERRGPGLDKRTSATKPPATINGDAMDISELKETVTNKSPSLCNQQLRVTSHDCYYGRPM